jgi:excisionase family DNA binding protein
MNAVSSDESGRFEERSLRTQRRTPNVVALLGISDLAMRLGTSERFVRRLVCERRVPFHKVGKFVRFDPKDIDAWLAESRVESMR